MLIFNPWLLSEYNVHSVFVDFNYVKYFWNKVSFGVNNANGFLFSMENIKLPQLNVSVITLHSVPKEPKAM